MSYFSGMMLVAVGTCFSLANAAHAETSDDAAATPAVASHRGTDEQQQRAHLWNRTHAPLAAPGWHVLRPFSEVEDTGFVAISANDDFELPALRLAIAQNLPAGVTLVVYLSDASAIPDLQQALGAALGDRLKFVVVPEGDDQDWARDSLPFPVYLQPAGGATTPSFGLVASIYPQNFDPNAAFSTALSLPMVSTQQYFRGGNLLFDEQANCFAENVNEVGGLSDPTAFFQQFFGCATVTLLDQEGGIGDIDERIKFLGGKKVLTDNQTYATLLAAKGYDVHMIPSTGADGETYMNTLLVNGTIFVPQMGIAADQDALQAYKDLGFTPVGVYTKDLADQGDGNIHCVTMNYPRGTFNATPGSRDRVEFSAAQGR